MPLSGRDDYARMLGDVADDGLATILNRHVLHGDGRLAIVAIAVERLHPGWKHAGQPAQARPALSCKAMSSALARR